MKCFAVFIKGPEEEKFNNTERAKNITTMLKKLKAYDRGAYMVYEIDSNSVVFNKNGTVSLETLDNGTLGFGSH